MAKRKDAGKEPERVTATDAYRNFAAYVDRARVDGDLFIITVHDRDAAALISVRELARLRGAA